MKKNSRKEVSNLVRLRSGGVVGHVENYKSGQYESLKGHRWSLGWIEKILVKEIRRKNNGKNYLMLKEKRGEGEYRNNVRK